MTLKISKKNIFPSFSWPWILIRIPKPDPGSGFRIRIHSPDFEWHKVVLITGTCNHYQYHIVRNLTLLSISFSALPIPVKKIGIGNPKIDVN
jgi:hypothetical protein